MQKTPMGEILMINIMIFMNTSFRLSNNSATGRPFSPARMIPAPMSSAITMICSIEALAKGAMMLLGKISTRVVIKSALVALSQVPSPSVESWGKLPLKMLASTRPMTSATTVVQM